LLARVFGVQSDRPRPHTDPAMWATVDALVPRSRAREFNWAMLDIGARLCLRDRPRCAECPMDQFCAYRRKQELGAA
jgi:A/G-specific adenine glycosylase